LLTEKQRAPNYTWVLRGLVLGSLGLLGCSTSKCFVQDALPLKDDRAALEPVSAHFTVYLPMTMRFPKSCSQRLVLTSSLEERAGVFRLIQSLSFGNGDRRLAVITVPASSLKKAEYALVSAQNAQFDLLPRFNDLAVRDGNSFAALRVTGIDAVEEVTRDTCNSWRHHSTTCETGHELIRHVSAIEIALPPDKVVELSDHLALAVPKPPPDPALNRFGWSALLSLVDHREDPLQQELRIDDAALAADARYQWAFDRTEQKSKSDMTKAGAPKPAGHSTRTVAVPPSLVAPEFVQPFDSVSKSAGTLK